MNLHEGCAVYTRDCTYYSKVKVSHYRPGKALKAPEG